MQRLLDAAGFTDVAVEPVTAPILLGGGGTLEDALRFLRTTSVLRAVLADAPDDDVARAVDAIAGAIEPHTTGDGFCLDGAAWVVTAAG